MKKSLNPCSGSRHDFPGVDHEGRQTCRFFDLLEMGQGHGLFFCFVFRREERQRACKKNYEDILFLGERLNFPENVRNFGAQTFFFPENA